MTISASHRYRSPLVDIHDFACSAPAGHCSGEEAAAADEIAFVRHGVFRKHGADGTHLIDSTCVALFKCNQPYVVDHPGTDGDLSTVLTFAAGLLDEALEGVCDSLLPVEALPSAMRLDRNLLLAFHLLLAALRRTPIDDVLVDECAMLALDAFRATAARHFETDARPRSHPGNRLGEEARVLLAKRWASRVTINGLAGELGVSPFHLCRRFREGNGRTVHQHLTALRMAAALERVGDHRNNLAQLALDLGYSSHSHFTTAFGAYFALPPSTAAAGERFLAVRKKLKARRSPMR